MGQHGKSRLSCELRVNVHVNKVFGRVCSDREKEIYCCRRRITCDDCPGRVNSDDDSIMPEDPRDLPPSVRRGHVCDEGSHDFPWE